jgi:hypothetical protein
MNKSCVVVAVSAGLLATLWTVPGAGADPRFHRRSAGGHFGAQSFHAGPATPHGQSFHGRGFGHHGFAPRRFNTFGGGAAASVVVYAPSGFYDAPLYDSTPAYSAPPYSPPVAPPVMYGPPAYGQPTAGTAMPRVVEFPTGRYELRGDGITAPYTWVWIPNPPSAPPAPPTAPPAAAPMSGDAPPARRVQVYRWVDEQGVIHWTDRAENVPRAAQRRDPS